MPYSNAQIVAHSSDSPKIPAIVRTVFSLVVRVPWTVRKNVPVYQVVHRTTGYHLASFVVADSAAGFFRDVNRFLPSFTNSSPERLVVKRLLVKWFAHQKRHEDYFPEDLSGETKTGFTNIHLPSVK